MGKSKAAFLKHSANLRGAFLTLKEATVFRNKLLNLLSQSNNDGLATSGSAFRFSLQCPSTLRTELVLKQHTSRVIVFPQSLCALYKDRETGSF